eukprot:gene7612-7675_t
MSGKRHVKELISAQDIAQRVESLALEIQKDTPNDLLVIAVLKGSFMFAADLLRSMHNIGMEPEAEFIHISSYGTGTVSTGRLNILKDIDSPVAGRDIVLVDDILESGRTLAFAKDLFAARGARSVRLCVLLEKPGHRAVKIDADYVGFQCKDLFVVGYGMDVAHSYRQLPFVGYVETEN